MTRGYLTAKEWDALLAQQGGTCITPGCESTGPFHGEHTVANYFVGGKPDALMCLPCHKVKTRNDKREIARTKRLNGETMSQHEKRKRFGPSFRGKRYFQERS